MSADKSPAIVAVEEWFQEAMSSCGQLETSKRGKKARHWISLEITTVEEPLALALQQAGHEIRRQVTCSVGRIDILDDTTFEIIECKFLGDASRISDAVNQLHRYQSRFPGAQLAVAVPYVEDEAEWMIKALDAIGIRIIEVDKGVGV